MIVYLAADLIWATRIKGVADHLGLPCRPTRDCAMLEARLADSPVSGFVADLDAGDRAIELIRLVREFEASQRASGRSAAIRILAFGPHVATDLLQQARDAGADDVLPRGSFDRNLPDLLLKLAPADPEP